MKSKKYNVINTLIENNIDQLQAMKMASYMQNKLKFAGIPKSKLDTLIKPFLKETAKEDLDWDFIFELWKNEYREAQYVALEYLKKHRKQLIPEDISNLKKLIVNKSWWDTVDTIDAFVGDLVLKDNSLVSTILKWAVSNNIWLRRVAINFQQEYKDKTNPELLETIIGLNLGSDEFFINKAIGWSLRDYSKVNPKWVSDYLKRNKEQLSTLSIKEASKYLK